jgi:hypothetical protein
MEYIKKNNMNEIEGAQTDDGLSGTLTTINKSPLFDVLASHMKVVYDYAQHHSRNGLLHKRMDELVNQIHGEYAKIRHLFTDRNFAQQQEELREVLNTLSCTPISARNYNKYLKIAERYSNFTIVQLAEFKSCLEDSKTRSRSYIELHGLAQLVVAKHYVTLISRLDKFKSNLISGEQVNNLRQLAHDEYIGHIHTTWREVVKFVSIEISGDEHHKTNLYTQSLQLLENLRKIDEGVPCCSFDPLRSGKLLLQNQRYASELTAKKNAILDSVELSPVFVI